MAAVTIYPVALRGEDGLEKRLGAMVTRERFEQEQRKVRGRGDPWLWHLIEIEPAEVSEHDLQDGFFLFPEDRAD